MTLCQALGLCMTAAALGGAVVNLVYVSLFRRIARDRRKRRR